MSCFNPIWAYKDVDLETGQVYPKISSKNFIISHLADGFIKKEDVLKLPCGKCVGCKLDYGKKWAGRCLVESEKYEDNYFLTLTYNDENIPRNKDSGLLTLQKEDLKKFWKNLRRQLEYHYDYDEEIKIRYFACGEYGEHTERPHYHAIVFNLKLHDKELLYKKGDMEYYQSDFLNKVWKKGFVTIGKVTYESIAYTAGYVMKKALKNQCYIGREKEFIVMSTHPGIAKDFYEENKDKIYETDELIVKTKYGIQSLKPPRYFDKMYDLENPERLKELKELRKINGEYQKEKILKEVNMTEDEFNKMKEETIKRKLKKKSRSKV